MVTPAIPAIGEVKDRDQIRPVIFINGQFVHAPLSSLVDGSGGDMQASIYDPASKKANVYDRANHTGTQPAGTITGLGSAAFANSSAFATAVQGATADAAVPKAGGTMTGLLTLSGAPTAGLHAATKAYVDAAGGKGVANAWVDFDGSNGTIRKSFNVSSVTRTGTGTYTVNLSPAMADVNFVPVVSSGASGATRQQSALATSASAVAVRTATSSGAQVDSDVVALVIFGG